MLPLRDNIPSQQRPWICYLLIAANVFAFIHEVHAPTPEALETMLFTWGVVPARISWEMPTAWVTLVSSMFLHGGWMHLIGNMWFLWIFGDNV
ncbi:MAG: rhomboid family intramembrane serine protease, partial [Elusimicrobia bacterium]|nr:rhomboid family intramembrane serine protease [Elusimicrobiota bacterium]